MGATLSTSRWEDIAATSPGNHTFQLYVLGDREWQKDVVARIVAAGFAAICVTMDTPRIARRDAALEASYNWATPPQGTVNLTDGWDYTYRTAYTWDDLEWLCSTSPVPVVVKGVLHPGDARIAVDCGASGIYVSNHGGRVVDHEVSPIEMLGEIVGMVPSEVDVVVDSGFTRGAEVCKAVALGAKAVGIGRLQCWGLAIGGADGVAHVLEILRSEIAVTMANLGCSRLTDLTPAHVRWSMSAPPITG
jgi:isopentenyl diphosphate isomerase/L-lactate dehydrogenase-like FMN-dependent dehydrogenase